MNMRIRGVHRSRSKWEATIGRSRSSNFQRLGLFNSFEEAVKARKQAEIQRFGHEHGSEKIKIENSIAYVPVFNRTGKHVAFATIDPEDVYKISGSRWCLSNGYAVARSNNKLLFMHKVITNTKELVDHIDRNRLNNCKLNFRFASVSQNNANSLLRSNNKSGYKGVCFCKCKRKWRVTVKTKIKQHHVGYFADLLEAAKAYDTAAVRLNGSFAATNKMLGLIDGH